MSSNIKTPDNRRWNTLKANKFLFKYGLKKQAPRAFNFGEELGEPTRSYMENLLGYELKDVRIHETRQAGELARRLNADAFTIGRDIFAPESKLSVSDSESRGLLAHELTHVIQQIQPQQVIKPNNFEPDGNPVGQEPGIIRQANEFRMTDVHPPQLAPTIPAYTGGNTPAASMESEAEQAEQTARARDESNPENEVTDSINTEDIAERVYKMMQLELLIELDRIRRH
jgi:hypothetical protein